MVGLRLGPLLRYIDEDTATVWVETDGPCEAEVHCDRGSAGGSARTWRVSGHHYALITVVGLQPGTETPYRVLLDGTQVWPLPDSPFPPSVIRTPVPDRSDLNVAFGSCRWAAPPGGHRGHPGQSGRQGAPAPDASGGPGSAGRSGEGGGPGSASGRVGPDALDALARQAVAGGERPDVLLLLGDQVYADETSEQVRAKLAERRDLKEPPGTEVADFEEYTVLYDESWLDPEVRWLLSTVPSCMIFDDHDVIDDWNTSESWHREMNATHWWRERILGGLASYWVYQHLGNLSPGELADDPVFAAVRAADDGTGPLREFAERADADSPNTRWSYRRDFGRVRLLMVDSRASRVLEERRRAMLDDAELAWLREQVLDGLPMTYETHERAGESGVPDARRGSPGGAGNGTVPGPAPVPGGYDHLLIGTSLPWLLPPAIHDAEAWNAALCRGVRGPRWARIGERLRRAADLEHWAAFPSSFDALSELIQEVAGGPGAPATVSVLSGDVHHAYISEPRFPRPVSSRVTQLTCSPVHNSVPAVMRFGFRFGWSRAGRWLGRALSRHGRVEGPALAWRRTGGPWFGNQLMALRLYGRGAELSLSQARSGSGGEGDGRGPALQRILHRRLTSREARDEADEADEAPAGAQSPRQTA
jgi:hypothetical protein